MLVDHGVACIYIYMCIFKKASKLTLCVSICKIIMCVYV